MLISQSLTHQTITYATLKFILTAVLSNVKPCNLEKKKSSKFQKKLFPPLSTPKCEAAGSSKRRKILVKLQCFYVLLTVHLSMFILVINQLDAHNLFYSKFISCLYMFREPCAHRQEVKIVLYSIWYHHTYMWPSRPVHRTATYMCDDTRGCIIQFSPPDDEHMVLETCRGMKETYCKTKFVHQVG